MQRSFEYELVANLQYYKSHSQFESFQLIAPSLETACKDCAKDGAYSSIFTMMALSSVLQREIRSVYPAMNGVLDKCVGILNTTLCPRIANKKRSVESIYLMWTRAEGKLESGNEFRTWVPNHFVPLVEQNSAINYVSSSHELSHDRKTSSPTTMHQTPVSLINLSEIHMHGDDSDHRPKSLKASDHESHVDESGWSKLQDIDEISTPSKPLTENQGEPQQELHGRFLDVESLCEILESSATVPEIPVGLKENIFFVVKNEKNSQKRLNGGRSSFTDDCGVWTSKASSTKKTSFYHDGQRLKSTEQKSSQYCTRIKGQWVPLSPQPNDDDIVIMRRFYATLKRKEDFKKRVTWIEKTSSKMTDCRDKAVVEYLGLFPETQSVHGNNKKAGNEYVRTSETVKEKIATKVKQLGPRNVYSDMILDADDSLEVPRNLKQVQNMKHRIACEKRTGRGEEHRKNTADGLQTVFNMINDHPFVQEVLGNKGKPPMVILYTEDQLNDVKNFCTSSSGTDKSVLGIDRTFNVGPCYLTLTVFKQTNLLRSSTQSPPIMLGPTFLHWDGSCETYQRFFSHLRTKLDTDLDTEIGFSELVVGTDEEKALMKAIRQSFPEATQLLCYRHLEENVRRYLQHKVGVNDGIKNEIVATIFGKDGLLHTKDSFAFDFKVLELTNKFLDIAPQFKNYFEKLLPRLRDNVFEPSQKNKWIPMNWTNNNCESINNIIKLSTNWHTLKVPDLIENLYRIVKLQYTDIRRAIHGQGNYELTKRLKHMTVTHSTWCGKTNDEKEMYVKKFLSKKVRDSKQERVVTSTDGQLTIPRTPTTAKKPGQRKRVRTERARPNKKLKL